MSEQTNPLVPATTTDVATLPNQQTTEGASFETAASFELAQRMAKALSASAIIPKEFQNNIPNCLIALELSHRMGVSPMMVMQNLNIIYGRPSFSSSFLIAMINSSNRFKGGLRFKYTGEGDNRSCYAWTVDGDATIIEGPTSSIAMAKAEGWYDRKSKDGSSISKWRTMPEIMLAYRAASFFARLYAPELMMGMKSVEEIEDAVIIPDEVTSSAAASVNDKIKAKSGEGS